MLPLKREERLKSTQFADIATPILPKNSSGLVAGERT
jgi:hypothetical protein